MKVLFSCGKGYNLKKLFLYSFRRRLLKEKPGMNRFYRAYSLTCPASMQIYCKKRKCLQKKRVELQQDWFGQQPGCHFIVSGHSVIIWKHFIVRDFMDSAQKSLNSRISFTLPQATSFVFLSCTHDLWPNDCFTTLYIWLVNPATYWHALFVFLSL